VASSTSTVANGTSVIAARSRLSSAAACSALTVTAPACRPSVACPAS
jgi:hypothetical protein